MKKSKLKTKRLGDIEYTESSGNVFADLDCEKHRPPLESCTEAALAAAGRIQNFRLVELGSSVLLS